MGGEEERGNKKERRKKRGLGMGQLGDVRWKIMFFEIVKKKKLYEPHQGKEEKQGAKKDGFHQRKNRVENQSNQHTLSQ